MRFKTNLRRVLSPDSPTRPRAEDRSSRLTALRGGRGGPSGATRGQVNFETHCYSPADVDAPQNGIKRPK